MGGKIQSVPHQLGCVLTLTGYLCGRRSNVLGCHLISLSVSPPAIHLLAAHRGQRASAGLDGDLAQHIGRNGAPIHGVECAGPGVRWRRVFGCPGQPQRRLTGEWSSYSKERETNVSTYTAIVGPQGQGLQENVLHVALDFHVGTAQRRAPQVHGRIQALLRKDKNLPLRKSRWQAV